MIPQDQEGPWQARFGWRLWPMQWEPGAMPRDYALIEVARNQWVEPVTIRPQEMPPEMNIAGLFWRRVSAETGQ